MSQGREMGRDLLWRIWAAIWSWVDMVIYFVVHDCVEEVETSRIVDVWKASAQTTCLLS